MITIDGDNLLVTLPAPTMGVLNVDVQVDLYSDWKEWMLDAFANMGYPPLFTTFGGDALSAGLAAGSYYIFNNVAGWRIKPDESNHDVNWVGQLVPLDSTLPVFVPTNGGFTVFVNGLQPISQVANLTTIETQVAEIHGQVRRGVYLNTEALVNGNGYQQTPFDNWSDAIDNAEALGLQTIYVEADATVDRNISNFRIIGTNLPTIDLGGFDYKNGIFGEVTITGDQGTGNSPLLALTCAVLSITNFNGSMLTVTVQGTISIADGAFCLINGVLPAVGGVPWTLDMGAGGAASTVQIQNISGGMIISNMDNASDSAHFAFSQGAITIDASCTAGTIVISGDVKVTDNSGAGCTVDTSATTSSLVEVQIFDRLVETGYTFEGVMRILASLAAGKINQDVAGVYQIRDINDTKNRIEGDDAANGGRDITAIDAT